MKRISDVIVKPLLTEKTSELTDHMSRYCFLVNPKTSKYDVKNAVENYFNVKVLKVTTATLPGKVKRSGRAFKKTSSKKKAYVQIDQGQKIELFKGI